MAEVTEMRNNALPYPVYGAPWTLVFPILDADGDLVTGATTPDAEVSKNGDTFADCTNESTEIATSSGMYYLTLTGTEMTADVVAVIAKSATAGAKTTPMVMYPRKLVTLRTGTAQGGAAGYITLDASAGAVNDIWNGCLCVATIDSNVEARIITDYNGSNQQASVTPNWNVTPDSDDTFVIYLPEGMQIPSVNTTHISGTVQTARDIGASVLLADDAITAAKFDESTAFPLKAADTGATYIARAPSGTETLDTIKSAISAIGSGTGAALNFAADDDNANNTVSGVALNAVGSQTGTFSNTEADDTSTHVIASADVTGTQTITWAYGFSCGAARSASKVTWKGTLSGGTGQSDTFTFSAYNWGDDDWDTRYVIANTSSAVQTFDIPLLAAHTGTSGAEAGKVIIRIDFAEADAGTLTTNLILVQAQQSGSLVGYSDGAVWLNTAASNTNTTPYIDGVADNPVSTIAAALTVAAALSLKRIRVANGSSVTLGAAVEAYSLIGKNWALALGGQSISGSYIEGATVTGTGTGASPPKFVECHLVGASNAPTLPPCTLVRCGVNTTTSYPLTAGSAGQFLLVDCFSEVAGSGTPYFTFGGANGINIRRWSGGTNITLDNTSTTLSVEVVTGGGQTIAVGGADVEIRGICRAVTLTGVTSDSTVQINAVTGPISIAGAEGTVNIYGVCGVVTDNRTGTPTLSNKAVSQATINAEVDSALADYDAPTATEMTNAFTEIKGATWSAATDTLEHIRDKEADIETDTQDLQTQIGTAGAGLTAVPEVDANITKVNNIAIDGAGTVGDPWGPA